MKYISKKSRLVLNIFKYYTQVDALICCLQHYVNCVVGKLLYKRAST